MNRVFFKSCLLVILWFCCASWVYAAEATGKPAKPKAEAPAASTNAPVLQVPEATHDFGEVLEGIEVTHDFKIKNAGKGELQIEQVRPG